jgi:hypothetical protein
MSTVRMILNGKVYEVDGNAEAKIENGILTVDGKEVQPVGEIGEEYTHNEQE